jgi:hypothetical protein
VAGSGRGTGTARTRVGDPGTPHAGGRWRRAPRGGARDGNGDPILDFSRGIPLLGDGDGKKMIPTGI